ncbi:MAG: response regulator [Actinobacteria bacterium]|nr:response regulator [Actinomycetota bacterium]MSW36809.1 response regulator [Actinomycetota bacterium]
MSGGPQEPEPYTRRLERRAAREHAARLEAERMAEGQLRRAYDQAREVELLASIARVVLEAVDATSALSAAAKVMRRHCDFAVSHVLVPDVDGVLVTSDIWDVDDGHVEFLDRVMTATADEGFGPSSGLPGDMASSHVPEWFPDLRHAPSHLRQEAIPSGSYWAFPVIAGVDVTAVMEFFHPTPRGTDERLLRLAPSVGAQLGSAFEREWLFRRQEADRRHLEELVAARTQDIARIERRGREVEDVRAAFVAYLVHENARVARSLEAVSGTLHGEVKSAIEGIVRLADQLAGVVEGVDRRLIGRRELIGPSELLASVAGPFEKDARIVLTVAEDLTDGTKFDLSVPYVQRALSELIENAARHSGSEVVELSGRLDSGSFTVEVRDSGIGFTWPQNGLRPTGGGGLAQVARLASALGGSLEVRAAEPKGTIARLQVATRERGPAPWASRSTRVLLVDDNEVNRRLAGAMLDRIGLRADVVDGGEAALAALRSSAYGLVFMDVQMPGVDGREATRIWRRSTGFASPADIPIVALTAHVGKQEREECTEAGMNDYLSKPFGIEDLGAMAKRWLEPGQTGRSDAR